MSEGKLAPAAVVAEIRKNNENLLIRPPRLLHRVLTKYGMDNKTMQALFQKFSKSYLEGDESHQNLTLREMASAVLNQMADHFERVTAEQWKANQIESWQGKLLGQAGSEFKDTDQFRMTTVRWGDPKSLYAPVGTAPRILEMEMEETMFTSLRFARGIQIPLDALFTDDGFQWIIDGIGHLLQGALVTQALLMTEELIDQRFYDTERLNRCTNVAQYEMLLKRNDTLRCAYNKFDNPQAIYENEARADMAPYTEGGPNAWIVSEDALAFLKNNLKGNQQFYESGHRQNYTGHTDTNTIQKVDSALGSPTGEYYPLPANFIKDSPLAFEVLEGSAWNMGQNPNRLPLKLADPAKYDIDMYCKATDNKAHLTFISALENLKDFFDPRTGNIMPIRSGGHHYKRDEDEKEDKFLRSVDGGSSFVPIEFYGQYNISRTELLVRHGQSLVELAARRMGKTVADFNDAFANWFDEVDKMDNASFDYIDKAFNANEILKEQSDDIYRQQYRHTSTDVKSFASSFYKLQQFASTNSADSFTVNAKTFLRYLRALAATIDNVHECLITNPDSLPPEEVPLEGTVATPEAALYARCMAAMHMDHYHIFANYADDNGLLNTQAVAPLITTFGGKPFPPTGKIVIATDNMAEPMNIPQFILKQATNASNTRALDEVTAVVRAVAAHFLERKITPKNARKYWTAQVGFSTAGADGKTAIAPLTTWDELKRWLELPNVLSTESLQEYQLLMKAVERTPSDELLKAKMVMTDLSIPKKRYDEFVRWKIANKKLYEIQSALHEGSGQSKSGIGFLPLHAQGLQVTTDDNGSVDLSVGSSSGFAGRGRDGKFAGSKVHITDRGTENEKARDAYFDIAKQISEITETDCYARHIQNLHTFCTNDVEKFATFALLFSRFNKRSVQRSVLNGCVPLLNLLVVSPQISYRATSTVGLKRGADTGKVNTTQMDMRFSISAAIKYFLGHLSFKFGVWITNPKNVWAWIGSMAQGVLSGGRGGENQFTTNEKELKRGAKDLAVMPMSAEDWPTACHFSFIGRYAELDEVGETNRCTCFISTAYRNNETWDVYTSRRQNHLPSTVSPGSAWYMNEQGRFDDFCPDQGIFGARAVPGMHKIFMGIQRIKEGE
jgi:hypothetical protein